MVIYRSREFMFHNRVAAVSLALCLVALAAITVASGAWDEAPALGVVLGVLLGAAYFVPLTVTVVDDGTSRADSDGVIHVSLAGVMRRSIPLSDVKGVKRRHYRPLREFGGWGWRQAWRRPARAYTTRGSSAVVLHMRDKSEIYLGVSDEQGLVDALKTRIHH